MPVKDLQAVNPNTVILSICRECGGKQISFAEDFRSLTMGADNEFSCKIAGRGRITLDDWVYIPGQPRPGQVKTRIRQQENEIFTLVYEGGREEKITLPINNTAGREAMRTYKLLPFQIGHTLLGDYIYHVGRDKTGRAVGLIRDKVEKLMVLLEDDSILIMDRKSRRKSTDNSVLEGNVKQALENVGPVDLSDVEVKVRQEIVFLNGACGSLFERETLIRFVESIEGVRAVISKIKVYPRLFVQDEVLESIIHERLFNQNTGIFGIELFVKDQVAHLRGYIQDKVLEDVIYQQLISVDGLRELRLQLDLRERPSFSDVERTRQVVDALKKNMSLENARIRVSTLNGITYLEGSVRTTLQKNSATFAAMWAGKNFKVENNLKVNTNFGSSSYIRMV